MVAHREKPMMTPVVYEAIDVQMSDGESMVESELDTTAVVYSVGHSYNWLTVCN